MLTPRSLRLMLVVALLGTSAQAQTRFRIDPKTSLAWWQVNPHLNHLWATTCPQEPSWRPGEGRTAGWSPGGGARVKQGHAGVSDTTMVPIYPRPRVRAVCDEAVAGEVLIADTASWEGVRGQVTVRADALVTGETRRDNYAREAVLDSRRFEHITFTIDSLTDVTRQADTIRATTAGMFSLHGVSKPMTAGVQAWPEAGGLRVLAKFKIPAWALTEEFRISKMALGLGVMTDLWYHLFMGVDVVLRPATEGTPARE